MIINYEILEILEESDIIVDFRNKRLSKEVKLIVKSQFLNEPYEVTKRFNLEYWRKAKRSRRYES